MVRSEVVCAKSRMTLARNRKYKTGEILSPMVVASGYLRRKPRPRKRA